MSTVKIRLLLAFFFFLFIITAPLIILFFQGYRFDSEKKIFVYSGSITIKSWPRDIDIYLNDKKQNKKRLNTLNGSYTINGIHPGKYKITCKKEGYTTWEKFIDVHSGLSSEFWNVILFPLENRKEKTFSNITVEQFFLSPRKNEELILFSQEEDTKKIFLLDTKKDELSEIFSLTDPNLNFLEKTQKENIEWNKDNNRILLPLQDKQGTKKYFILTLDKNILKGDPLDFEKFFQKEVYEKIINQENLLSQSFSGKKDDSQKEKSNTASTASESALESLKQKSKQKTSSFISSKITYPGIRLARWGFDKNEELAVLTNNGQLFYINLNDPQKTILISQEVSGFDFSGKKIYFSILPENIIWEVSVGNFSDKNQITSLPIPNPENNFLEMIVYDEYRISIRNGQKDLYVFNKNTEKNSQEIILVEKNVLGTQFSNDGKKLLYWTNNEIWNLMLREWKTQPVRQAGEKIFITRFSRPVKNVQWMDNYENIIFSIDKDIKSAELDTRDRINIIDVAYSNFSLEENDIYYRKENQQLIWKINEKDDRKILKLVTLIEKNIIPGLGIEL